MVLFDEAHNLITALSEIYSPRVTKEMLSVSLSQLRAYYERYADRLSSLSYSFLIQLQSIVQSLLQLLTTPPASLGEVSVLPTDQFLLLLHLEGVNLFDILHFIAAQRIVNKLNGFVDRMGEGDNKKVDGGMSKNGGDNLIKNESENKSKNESDNANRSEDNNSNKTPRVSHFPAVLSFIASLTSEADDTRIVVSCDRNCPYVQLLLLNPEAHFTPIVRDVRSVIITGGTLQPVSSLSPSHL